MTERLATLPQLATHLWFWILLTLIWLLTLTIIEHLENSRRQETWNIIKREEH